MTSSSARTRIAAALVSATVLLVAGCSSSSSKGGAGSPTTKSAANPALLGPVKQASGGPFKIGYIYPGQAQGIDGRSELTMAQATVKYVNEHLGGIAGRPVELVVCADNANPAAATDCANQMIAAKVPAVLSAAPPQPAPVIKLLAPAKIPYFTYVGIEQTVLLSPDGYVVTDPLGSVAAGIKVAKDAGVKKVAMVLIDVPAAVGPIESVATPLYKTAGLEVSYTAVAPGTPDMTPQIQAALSKGPQEFSIIGDENFCISALGALKTLGFSGNTLVNSQCLGPNLAKSVPGGIDGVAVGTSESLDSRDPQVALYEAVAAQYAPGTPPHESTNSGAFAVVLGFVRGMTGFTGEVTPSAVAKTLASMSPQPMPLLGGQTFKCDHTIALTPAACSTGAAILTLDASGGVKSSATFDASPFIKLG